jgi:hypothetical protein
MIEDRYSQPLTSAEVQALPAVPASSPIPSETRALLGSYVIEAASVRPPDVRTQITPVEEERPDGVARYRLDVEIQGARMPMKKYLPGSEARAGNADKGARRSFTGVDLGFRPSFTNLRMTPQRLPESPAGLLEQVAQPDERYFPFEDTTFPWCTFGRVTTERTFPGFPSWATGVMVGPRHVLTNNRILKWSAQGPGWLVFAPSYFRGREPFGTAFAERTYFWRQLEVTFPTAHEHLVAFDYVVCVLNHRIGESTGWIGWNAGYDPAWNGQPLWGMVAYNKDFGEGHEPVYQDGIRVLEHRMPAGTDPPGQALILENSARLTRPEQLFPEPGGPLFGWWPQEAWPRVIGVHSSARDRNRPALAAGGLPLSWLIEQARAEFP